MFDYQPEILAFAEDFAIPFDNDQAERDLRMARVQISGGWRTENGIQICAPIRNCLPYTAVHHLHITGPSPSPPEPLVHPAARAP